MGYIANIDFKIKVKENKEEELQKYLEQIEDIDFSEIEINKGYLEGDFYGNYYEEDWYKFLKDIISYIEDDEKIFCDGEDYTIWAFHKKKNQWYECETEVVITKAIKII